MTRVASTSRKRTAISAGPSAGAANYYQQSQRPLTSLIFLLPLIILYEVGTCYYASDPSGRSELRIIAFNLMQDFFRLCGASGKYLPALAVVGILLAWHVARKDPWRVSSGALVGMAIESAILGLPVI